MKNLVGKDQSQTAQALKALPDQLSQAFFEASKAKSLKVKNVVVAGMGGSNLASEMARSVFNEQIKVPFVLTRGYSLPGFVNKDTLAIISSYSGNTEEALSCFKQALAKKAKVFVLSSGGKLLTLASKNKIPSYQFSLKHNPSKQPRYGVGSQLGALLAVLRKNRIVNFSTDEIREGVQYLKNLENIFGFDSPKNPAKVAAQQLKKSLPLIVSAEFLTANTRILNNQINESAKNLSFFYSLPELNHHLLEGLENPKEVIKRVKFLFLTSNLFSEENLKRIKVTQKVLAKKKIQYVSYRVKAKTKLTSALEALLFGSYLSLYLAEINQVDPEKVEWVDYFKKELVK